MSNATTPHDHPSADAGDSESKRCRICLASEDDTDAEELGRLIRPCLCKGSIQFVHIKCLQRWRTTSNNHAFYRCPQCHYAYRFARTRAVGLATNPVLVGTLSVFLFTLLTISCSFITTSLISIFDPNPRQNSTNDYYGDYYFFYLSPFTVARELIRAALRILQEGDPSGMFESVLSKSSSRTGTAGPDMPMPMPKPQQSPGLIARFFLGLPILSASSLLQLVTHAHVANPLHFLARMRTNRRRQDNSRDIASLILVLLLLIGAVRAILKVYDFTRKWTVRILLRAEDAILEVN